MKRIIIPMTAALLAIAGTALAAEFQPMGALGIGGAGVARTTNAYAAYWNPAGLAFNEMTFSVPLDVSVGLRVSKGLADNVDRLSKFTEKGNNGEPSVIDQLKDLNTTGSNPTAVRDMVNLLAVIDDIKAQKGTLSINGNAVLAMQIKHLAFGAFGTIEGFAQPLPDLVNVLPTSTGGTTVSAPIDFYTAAGLPLVPPATAGYTPRFFSNDQIQGIANVFSNPQLANHIGTDQALALAQTIDQQMASNPNPTGLSNSAIYNTVTTVLSDQLIASNTGISTNNTINNNKTAVMVKSLAYVEFPLAYGHAINLGAYGKLGIGGSVKVVQGRVYQSRLQLINSDKSEKSNDILKNFTKNFEESTSVTVDLGALWRYKEWINVGIVAKNLTSPSFESPNLKNQKGVYVDNAGNEVLIPIKDESVKLKPQVRLGVALDPLRWLTIAADLDLTDNETVLSGLGYKSRTLGGGLELHPFTWFKLRAGMYKNLSNSEIGPVATAGLTFGTRWVNLEVDGAYGLETAQFKEKSYPKEARAQASLNIQF
ncbi:MAG TPA: conjugal transfer protein TraF [Geomonas sp.]